MLMAVLSGVPRAAADPDVGSQTPIRSRPSTLRRGAVDESLPTADETVAAGVPPPPEQAAKRLTLRLVAATVVVIGRRRATLPIARGV
jgi:hypothetical protein